MNNFISFIACQFFGFFSYLFLTFDFDAFFQLASANQNLHNIFVSIPIAERLAIIAKDREWQQFKTNRFKMSDNQMFVNGNSQLARMHSARFERKF